MSLSRSSNTTTANTKTPDSFRLYEVTITNYAGETIDISPLVQEFTIEENLFLMGCVFEFSIVDAVNLIDKYKITGNESLKVTMRKKNKEGGSPEEIIKNLYLVAIPTFARPSPNASTYKFKAITRDAYLSKSKRLSKSFDGTVGSIIENIYNNELGGQVESIDSSTEGNVKIIAPNYTIFDTINWLLQKAVKSNGTPFFLYETAKDGVKLNSYENIIGLDPYGKYSQAYAFTEKVYSEEDFEQRRLRIQSVSSNLGFSTFSGFYEGAYSATTHKLDYATKKYETEEFNIFNDLNLKIDNEPILSNQFSVDGEDASTLRNAKNFYMNINSLAYKDSNTNNLYQDYTDHVAKRNAILVNLNQFSHSLTIRGDFNLQPGKMIEIELPKATDPKAGEDGSYDELLSGKYIIVGTKHRFDQDGYKIDLKVKKDSVKR